MKVASKILLMISGICFVVWGITGIVSNLVVSIQAGSITIYAIIAIIGYLVDLFVGYTAIKCVFRMTPSNVRNAFIYGIIVLVFAIANFVLDIANNPANVLGYVVALDFSIPIVYMVGAFLARAYINKR